MQLLALAPLHVSARIANLGGVSTRARVQLLALTSAGPLALGGAPVVDVPRGRERPLNLWTALEGMDGRYRIELRLADVHGREELLSANNSAWADVLVPADYASWPYRFSVTASAGSMARRDEPVTLRADVAEHFDARAADLNLTTIRVLETDAAGRIIGPVPAQFLPREGARGELCWLMPGDTAPGAQRHFLVVCREADAPSGPRPMGELSWDAQEQAFESPVYRAVFRDGVISGLHALQGLEPRRSFLSSLGVSSEATGWVDEVGTVTGFQVVDTGPVRVVVQVKKQLRGDYEYAKTYSLYRDYFVVETDLNKPISHTSRAYYLRPCQFEDDKGNRAVVDGKGEAEAVAGKDPDPQWYACYSDEWAHSCVALSPFSNTIYWDAGNWGGIGFNTGATEAVRVAYVVRAGQPDASFAAADYVRLTHAVQVAVKR
jgi:hypothetical protein